MNAPSVDIKDMLEAYSTLGLVYTDNLFIGVELTEPKNCVTIFDSPGMRPQLTMKGLGEKYEYPSVQIRVRNSKYLVGWDLINEIKDYLHGRNHETWGGSLYTAIICVGSPALLDWDENRNARFIINFNLQRR